MPEMILHRDHRLATTRGHVMFFKKGEPINVPKAIVQDALAIGAVFADEAVREAELPSETEAPPAPVGDERETAIITGFQTLMDRNDREDFTAAGAPTAAALDAAVGFKVDKRERAGLWTRFQEMKAQEAGVA